MSTATVPTPSVARRRPTVRRKRLVFLTITFHPEPGALRGLPLAQRLVESGDYDVTVITAFPWYPLGRIYDGYRQRPWARETMHGVRVIRVPIYPSHDLSALHRIATYVSFMLSALVFGMPLSGPADVVYHADNLPTTGLVALLYGKLRGAAVVQHIADMWPESVTGSGMLPRGPVGAVVGRVLRVACDFVYRRNDRLTVLSPGFKRLCVERGVPAEKVDVLYNWAEENRFFPVPRNEAVAARLGFTGKFNVVYAGNVGPLQALEVVVHAAARLRDLPHVQLSIIGTGPRLDAVRELARSLGVTNVNFVDRIPVDEMNVVNAASDVLLVHLADAPFLHSTIPSKVQVALASARPVLLGVRGDAADLVREAEAGLTFTPEDAE
ncbi:MAG: glycosyltransferase family 4 protein, partial [Gemmatimonadaceae bacterium]|nr:glycosyltransferase family 4 protein [Gemmatimonadaceae bacterium]